MGITWLVTNKTLVKFLLILISIITFDSTVAGIGYHQVVVGFHDLCHEDVDIVQCNLDWNKLVSDMDEDKVEVDMNKGNFQLR